MMFTDFRAERPSQRLRAMNKAAEERRQKWLHSEGMYLGKPIVLMTAQQKAWMREVQNRQRCLTASLCEKITA